MSHTLDGDVIAGLEGKTQALVPKNGGNELQVVSRPPEAVLKEAQGAAQTLQTVIESKESPITVSGKQYLCYEDWLLLGQFYGSYCRTQDAQPVTVDGVKGFKARAEVLDRNGVVIGGAEAFCLSNEPNWRNKPAFQLASMAQTRAGSKAMANRLRWVAVLAKYKGESIEGTPYEEMTDTHTQPAQRSQQMLTEEPRPQPVKPQGDFHDYNQQKNDDYRGGTKITDKQAKRLFAISKSVDMPTESLRELVKGFGYTASKDILKKDYEEIVDKVQKFKQDLAPEQDEDILI
jgi:hypothetical protein